MLPLVWKGKVACTTNWPFPYQQTMTGGVKYHGAEPFRKQSGYWKQNSWTVTDAKPNGYLGLKVELRDTFFSSFFVGTGRSRKWASLYWMCVLSWSWVCQGSQGQLSIWGRLIRNDSFPHVSEHECLGPVDDWEQRLGTVVSSDHYSLRLLVSRGFLSLACAVPNKHAEVWLAVVTSAEHSDPSFTSVCQPFLHFIACHP